MCKRIMAATRLGLIATLLAFPAFATTNMLLIGTPPSGKALEAFRTSLKSNFGIDEIQVARTSNSHEVAEHVREYLLTITKHNELRVLWIVGSDSVCPNFDEIPIRPLARTLIIAQPCAKLLIQAPTTYERLGADMQDDREKSNQWEHGVAFVSLFGDFSTKPDSLISKAIGSLPQTLACKHSEQISLDFAPSVSAWGVHTSQCETSPQAANVHLPSSQEAKDLERSPEISATSESATLGETLKFNAPVSGKVITIFGAETNGKPNNGEDIEVTIGTVVKAAEGGEVVFVGELSGYGLVVAIKHDKDWATIYAHTSHPRVAQGQKVSKGQELSDVDISNKLHFELRRKGKPIDPGTVITITS